MCESVLAYSRHRPAAVGQILPSGWETAVSRSTGRAYYVNVATGDSQFEFPSAPVCPRGTVCI